MESQLHIVVLMFASHREVYGEARVTLALPPGSTVDALYGELESRVPRLAELRPFTTFALNREVVSPDTALTDGDEVALLQPVSGGRDD